MPAEEAGCAIVTGAGSGIGRAVALRLASLGYRVVVAEIDIEAGRMTARDIQSGGGKAVLLACDVANTRDVHQLIDETVHRFGHLDVLVNNAGIAGDVPYPDAEEESWRLVIDVNLTGTMLATQLAARAMRGRGGVVVNISSMAGWGLGPHENPEYAATKAAIVRLTAALAPLVRDGIRVNAICPGWVATEKVTAYLDALDPEARLREAPKRLILPEEIAELVMMFIRDRSLAGRVFVWPDDKPLFMPEAK